MHVYLDHAAATPVTPAALEAFLAASESAWANAESAHLPGRQAKEALEAARAAVARKMEVPAEGLVFVSCATEGNNMAIMSAAARRGRRNHAVATAYEHASVTQALRHLKTQGCSVTAVPPDASGRITADALAQAVTADTFLVCCARVCSETGAVMPVDELKRVCPDVWLHCDNTQGFLRTEPVGEACGVDSCVVSGHKVGAPKGAAAVWLRPGVSHVPLLRGGRQEAALRAGTVNVPSCVAFAAAADSYAPPPLSLLRYAEDVLEGLPGVCLLRPRQAPHILPFALPGCPAEVAARMLSDMGIYISAGAACSKGGKSEALTAQKLPSQVVAGALRASFAACTARGDIDALAEGLRAVTARLARRH